MLVQVWVAPLRRPRPARDEGTGGLVLRALSGVHHDCCLSPLKERSCPVALVSCFRSDCVSASRVPRRHFSFSLSPSLCCQPGETLRRATSATEKKRECARFYEVGATENLKNRFFKAKVKEYVFLLLYSLCCCWQSTNILVHLHYNFFFFLVNVKSWNIFKVGKCADRLSNIWFSNKKVIHDLMLCLDMLCSKCWTCNVTIAVTWYFKVPWTVQHQFHCATVLFVGVIFTLLLTKNI